MTPAPHPEPSMEPGDTAKPVLPVGCRATLSNLTSRSELNGVEVAVLEWKQPQGRFAVRTVGREPHGVLVRPESLSRCACPFDALPLVLLDACLSRLDSWNQAARAWAVHPSWRNVLRSGAWPSCANVDLVPPSSWPAHRAVGFDWDPRERRPYAHPRRWAVPTAAPSWTAALCGLPGADGDGPASVLRWLDRMDSAWPSVCLARWSGVARRLAWLRGDAPDAQLYQLAGWIYQSPKPPYWAPREVEAELERWFDQRPPTPANYRPGASWSLERSTSVGHVCRGKLPADAALFWALMPSGFGEHKWEADRGEQFSGLVVMLEPWRWQAKHTSSYARMKAELDVNNWPAEDLGCDPALLLSVARELRDEFDDERSQRGGRGGSPRFNVLLCCDEASRFHGKLLCVHYRVLEGKTCMSVTWRDLGLAGLLHAIADTAEELRAETSISEWDKLWGLNCNANGMGRLLEKLEKSFDPIPCPRHLRDPCA